MGEVVVRRARPDDLSAAAELLEEMERIQSEWRVFQPRQGIREEVLARYRLAGDDPDSLHLVAEEDGTVVGMALAALHRPSSFSSELSVEVSSFVVGESSRGQGVGRALIAAIGAFARERRVRHLDLKVFVQNEPAIDFWTRVGFRPRMLQMVAETDVLAPPEP